MGSSRCQYPTAIRTAFVGPAPLRTVSLSSVAGRSRRGAAASPAGRTRSVERRTPERQLRRLSLFDDPGRDLCSRGESEFAEYVFDMSLSGAL